MDPRMLLKGEQCPREHLASRVHHGHEPSHLHPVCSSEVGETSARVVHSQKLPSALAFRKVVPTPQMSEPAGPSFPSKAPIPQELSEAKEHNPLLTRKNKFLVKSQGGLWILGLNGKRNRPRLCRTDAGERASHHSMHTECLLSSTRAQGCSAAALHEWSWGGRSSTWSCSFSGRQKGGHRYVFLSDSPQNAALGVQ